MVFFPPHMNKTYYIKRVIGLPGDVVSYRNKRLYVNGEPVPFEPAGGHARGAQSLPAQPGRTSVARITCSRSTCCARQRISR
jgi:signal peptidase I